MPENADNIIFVTYNMYCYLRDQSVDLGDMGSSANYQSILKIILKQGGNAHWSLVEIRDKFKQIYNSPSGFVSWQNKRVQCKANL